MNKLIVCILFFTLSCSAFSQNTNTIAKLKYEEAEAAFAANNFSQTISKLDEVEKLLGSTNPKVLYLRIMADAKIIEADPYKSFGRLDATRKNCAYYLTKYENNEGIEEKYTEVYKISESLTKYPATEDVFSLQQKNAKEKNDILSELLLFSDSLCSMFLFRPDLTLNEFNKYNGQFDDIKLTTYNNGNFWGPITTSYLKKHSSLSVKGIFEPGPTGFMTDESGKVIQYHVNLLGGKGSSEEAKKLYNEMKDSMKYMPPKYMIEKENNDKISPKKSLIFTVPYSIDKPDEIRYYITFSLTESGKWHSLSIAFSTNKKIAFW